MTELPGPAAVVYAKDLPGMLAFYAAVTGLPVTHQEAGHGVLASAAFELVLLAIPPAIAETIHITRPPQRRSDTPVKLVFPVDSLERVRAQAAALGGALDPPEREWVYRGLRTCDGLDPEGNVLQFRQPGA